MIRNIITIEEADTYLALEADWLELDDPAKTNNISRASVYVQTKWVCNDIDYDDEDTIPEVVKEACAWYALANSRNLLYPDMQPSDRDGGFLTEKTIGAGALKKTIKFSEDGNPAQVLSYPDDLMGTVCSVASSGGAVMAVLV